MILRIPTLLLCLICCFSMMTSYAKTETLHPAQSQLQDNITTVLNIVNDRNSSEEDKMASIERYADEYLDYQRIAALSVGLKWKSFSTEQKNEFIRAFKDLVVDLYVRKGIYQAQDANVKLLSRFSADDKGQKFAVFIEILNARGKKYTVEYQLYKSGNTYKIYNIKVEDLSFVSIFRSQFNESIDKKGIDGFIEDLKAQKI